MYLDVRVMASPFESSRVGIVVPRHQHSAVDRNRLKRRLRELVRLELLPSLREGEGKGERSAVDLAIRARREAYTVTLDRLRADIATIRSRVTNSDPVA
jgi:ribonuclease P protein component